MRFNILLVTFRIKIVGEKVVEIYATHLGLWIEVESSCCIAGLATKSHRTQVEQCTKG